MYKPTIPIMVTAATFKIAIMTSGVSIPNYLEANPEINELPKADRNYIIGQAKKLLIAMKQGR